MEPTRTHTIQLVLIGLIVFPLVGYGNSLNRDSDPVVLTGVELRSLIGVPVEDIVGFRWQGEAWQQIPIQVDERKYVDFGVVYGDHPVGHGVLAYTDPETYVGPDDDPRFDRDDELIFMARDAGRLAPDTIEPPDAVLVDTQVQLVIEDPLDGSTGHVYLFESDGSLVQNAGQDYIAYDFSLLSGPYIPTFRTVMGPNPEDSSVRSDYYGTHFSDRWINDGLQIFSGSATGADILDRHTTGRGPGDCSRNENTASDWEGAFFTNKDGCIRAIRSYMGYNSGPYMQRDHFFYEKRQDICGYVRVHATTDCRDLYDYDENAVGMIYYNNVNLGGAIIDGQPDTPVKGPMLWEMVTGEQGTLVMCHFCDTDIPNYKMTTFYSDSETPPLAHCTGDGREFGLSGTVWDIIPNTDPTLGADKYLSFRRCVFYGAPDQTVDVAATYYHQANTPLDITAIPLNPGGWVLYVDDDAPHDPGPGDPELSAPNEVGSAEHPFDNIQEAIDYALDGEIIVVLSGTYAGNGNREIDFLGKAITVRSEHGAHDCIIDCKGAGRGLVFKSGEDECSILKGVTIKHGKAVGGGGIYLKSSSPTILNCLFVDNRASGPSGRTPIGPGGAIYSEDSSFTLRNCTFSGNIADDLGGALHVHSGFPTISNCIFWGNAPDEIHVGTGTPLVSYSNIRSGFTGQGNIDVDPLFADPDVGDFHLKSQAGCWNHIGGGWIQDDISSPCIDAGHPNSNWTSEPAPNGERINIGAYGGTIQASLSR